MSTGGGLPRTQRTHRTASVPSDGVGDLLDVAAAANYLGVNEHFIRRIVLERRVRYYKLGRYVRFRPGDLDDFVAAGAVEPVAPQRATSVARRS